MTQEQFANNAQSQLAAGITSGALSLAVAVASSFPLVPQFRIIVDSEIMLVTAISGTTFTVTRGVEGTTAASHNAAATVTHVITAAGLQSAIDVIGSSVYGTGVDGVASFDGTNTYSFASLSGSTYTLSRDVFLADGSSVASGITLVTYGYKLFCSGKLTNSGTIHNDGSAASGGTAGASSHLGTLGIGTAGGAGHAAAVGSGGTAQSNTLGDASAAGGAGGAGGANAGGAGGTYVASYANGGANFLMPILTGFIYSQSSGGNQAQLSIIGGGAGGGGGGSDNAGVTGGGGGGGGGVMVVAVFNLANSGTIRSAGGAGAAASGSGGNGGGGGGGAGGIIQLVHRYHYPEGSIVASGGAGGAAIGTGVAGTAGGTGHINHAYA